MQDGADRCAGNSESQEAAGGRGGSRGWEASGQDSLQQPRVAQPDWCTAPTQEWRERTQGLCSGDGAPTHFPRAKELGKRDTDLLAAPSTP